MTEPGFSQCCIYFFRFCISLDFLLLSPFVLLSWGLKDLKKNIEKI